MSILAQIREELRTRTGFSTQFLAEDSVKVAIQHRMQTTGCETEHSYWTRLQTSPAEWDKLIDEMVVTETWFLRDQRPFELLTDLIKKNWLLERRNPRILSAPCSTGEEPYSIAITLFDAGLSLDRIKIQAVDISLRALEGARNQTYKKLAFRGGELWQSQHFETLPNGDFRIAETIRQTVHFSQANLLDPGFQAGQDPFDIIFCRNLLIYLDDDSRARILKNLARLLSSTGVLFVGHADGGVLTGTPFQPLGPSNAFAFTKREPRQLLLLPAAPAPGRPVTPAAKPWTARPALPSGTGSAKKAAPAPGGKEQEPKFGAETLAQATRFADIGKLSEAAKLCTEYLKVHKADSKAIHLLALIRTAEGMRTEAERLFNQVAYLDPQHTEAMVHLATLCELRGDTTAARRWRLRLERTQANLAK